MTFRGFKDERATIEIDLTKNIDEIWNRIDKDGRWGVKKAEKEGLKIKEDYSEKELKEFYEHYKSTCLNGGINPEELDILKKKASKFFLCEYSGKIIAGSAIVIESKERYRLLINGSSYEYLKYQPNNLLYWQMVKWGKENGYLIFDLGGYQLDTKPGDKLYNVNRFKERWGGEIKKYEIRSYNPLYILGRKTIRKSKFFKKIWDKIKKRPKPKIKGIENEQKT